MGKNNNMLKVGNQKIKTPTTLEFSINDVSASDAGRTSNGLMHKNRVTRKRKMVLTWSGTTPAETKSLLQTFSAEYVDVTYYDPLAGTTQTRTFYSGDQTLPVKRWSANNKIFEQVSFDLIER